MIKVAIVGLGFMGRMHLSIYGGFKDIEITALCDSQKDNLDLKKKGGGNIEITGPEKDISKAKLYSDYYKMLDDGGFDFIDLCIPTFLHKDFSTSAMKKGYDVFCEKPMAFSVAEAEEMVKVSKMTGRLLTIGQCLRFWPMYVKIKELLDFKEYGKVLSAELSRYSPSPTWSVNNWINDGSLSGNAGLDLHIHDVDMIHYYFGAPRAVTSSGVKASGGGFGHISTLYDYPEMTVTSVGDWLCSDSFGLVMRVLIVMENAVINLDTSQPKVLTIFVNGKGTYYPELDNRDGYYHELRSFVDNVVSRTTPTVVTPESAMESLRTTFAEIESAKKLQKIWI